VPKADEGFSGYCVDVASVAVVAGAVVASMAVADGSAGAAVTVPVSVVTAGADSVTDSVVLLDSVTAAGAGSAGAAGSGLVHAMLPATSVAIARNCEIFFMV
jgi:hypothetical protein